MVKKALGILVILFGILLLIGSSGFSYIAFVWARSIPMGMIFLFLIALSIVLLVFGVN